MPSPSVSDKLSTCFTDTLSTFKTCLIGKTAYALVGRVKRMSPQEIALGRVLELEQGKESIHALSRGGHV